MKFNLRSIMTVLLICTLSLTVLTGCSKKETVELKDGTYTKTADKADDKGFTYEMKMTVKDGNITALTYDATTESGKTKSQMSLDGEYTMVEGGPTWAAQSESLAKFVIEHNSVNELTVNDDGKTDVVSGVSINVQGFVAFAEDVLKQAAK